jgi:chromate reductase
MNILTFAGTLRQNAYNKIILQAAAKLAPADMKLTYFDLAGIPLYNADEEAIATPERVLAFKTAIADADGLYIACPEYNHSFTGVLKNAMDWASRKPSPLFGKPVALVGGSPGGFGSTHAQADFLRICLNVGMLPLTHPRVRLTQVDQKIEDGQLVDAVSLQRIEKQLAKFGQYVKQLGGNES